MDRGSSYASQASSDASAKVLKRFSRTDYITSAAGILKLLLIIFFMIGGILFLSMETCTGTEEWYAVLYPTVALTAAIISFVIYAIFLSPIAKTNIDLWAAVDVTVSLVVSVTVIVACVLTLIHCASEDAIQFIPAETSRGLTEVEVAESGRDLAWSIKLLLWHGLCWFPLLILYFNKLSRTTIKPLGLVGAILLAANAVATYIMWKYQDVDAPEYAENPRFNPRNFLRRFTRTEA